MQVRYLSLSTGMHLMRFVAFNRYMLVILVNQEALDYITFEVVAW